MSLVPLGPSVALAQKEGRCSEVLIHDWYKDGQIGGRYTVGCYHAALADLPNKIVYRTMRTDLSDALASGMARVKKQGVPVGPRTVLPAPAVPVTGGATATSRSILFLTALGVVLLLLLAWSVARWRGPPSTT